MEGRRRGVSPVKSLCFLLGLVVALGTTAVIVGFANRPEHLFALPVETDPPTTRSPTVVPTRNPTAAPTSVSPTAVPTNEPTTLGPTLMVLTTAPTHFPTALPTPGPTASPTPGPTASPTRVPTASPTPGPTFSPTRDPTASPTSAPTLAAPNGIPYINLICPLGIYVEASQINNLTLTGTVIATSGVPYPSCTPSPNFTATITDYTPSTRKTLPSKSHIQSSDIGTFQWPQKTVEAHRMYDWMQPPLLPHKRSPITTNAYLHERNANVAVNDVYVVIISERNSSIGHYVRVLSKTLVPLGEFTLASISGNANCGPIASQAKGATIIWDTMNQIWLMAHLHHVSFGNIICLHISSSSNPLGTWSMYEVLYPWHSEIIAPPLLHSPILASWFTNYVLTARSPESTLGYQSVSVTFNRQAVIELIPFIGFNIAVHGAAVVPISADLFPDNNDPMAGYLCALYFPARASYSPAVQNRFYYGNSIIYGNILFGISQELPREYDVLLTSCGTFENCIYTPQSGIRLNPAIYHRSGPLTFRPGSRTLAFSGTLFSPFNVSTSVNDLAEIHWYYCNVDTSMNLFSLQQFGTIGAGGTSINDPSRYLTAAKEDSLGNVLTVYSVSSPTIYTEIRASYRLATDPPNTMRPEFRIVPANGTALAGGLDSPIDISLVCDSNNTFYVAVTVAGNDVLQVPVQTVGVASLRLPSSYVFRLFNVSDGCSWATCNQTIYY